jgi:hypothetical protein
MNKQPSGWADTRAAADFLGITPRQLRKLRKDGLFKLGKHYRITTSPMAAKPNYLWHCERCGAALEIPMEKR